MWLASRPSVYRCIGSVRTRVGSSTAVHERRLTLLVRITKQSLSQSNIHTIHKHCFVTGNQLKWFDKLAMRVIYKTFNQQKQNSISTIRKAIEIETNHRLASRACTCVRLDNYGFFFCLFDLYRMTTHRKKITHTPSLADHPSCGVDLCPYQASQRNVTHASMSWTTTLVLDKRT